MNDGGKGSARRPGENYSEGWDRIFNKHTLEGQVADDVTRGADEELHRAVLESALGRKPHYFMHTGRGKYSCQVCGKLEDYCHDGETCPGKQQEAA